MSSKPRRYQHRNPPRRSDREIRPDGESRPCPYCNATESVAGSVTVIEHSRLAHYSCRSCGRVYTVRTAR